jgi:adenosylcobinamide kinase / adenosylcobinamide-phosphate guanylyltransferase
VPLVVLIGGARSGKSALALERAASAADIVFLATGEARDEEMGARIERHRRERPDHWETVEEPVALRESIESADPGACLVVECLTLWVANVVEAGRTDDEIEAETTAAARAAAARPGATLVVTNEVGLGVVPDTPLGRRYRDVLGRVNAVFVSAADEAVLVVAGRAISLQSWA